jgi:hypothetical protein
MRILAVTYFLLPANIFTFDVRVIMFAFCEMKAEVRLYKTIPVTSRGDA